MIGVVCVARHAISKEIVCLKCMNCDKIVEKNLINNIKLECELHYKLKNEQNIMPLKKLIVREKEIVMVFPFIAGRDLYRYMRDQKKPKGHLTEAMSH